MAEENAAPPAEDPLLIIADAIEHGQMNPLGSEHPQEEPAAEEAPAEAQEAPAEEVKAEEPKEEAAPKEEAMTDSWKAVKEAEVLNAKQRAEIKAERDQLRKEQESSQSKLDEIKKAFADDPTEAVRHFGITKDEFIERVLNKGEPGESEKLGTIQRATDDKLAEVRKQMEEQEKSIQEAKSYIQHKEMEKARSDFFGKVKEAATDDEFELIRDHKNLENDVWNHTTYHYQQTGETLTPREATGKLMSEFQAAMTQLSSYPATRAFMKKLIDGHGAEPEANSDESKKPPEKQGYKPRTLTNAMSAQQPTPQPQEEEALTEYEELMQAAKLILPGS